MPLPLTRRNATTDKYFKKDLDKASICNKYIGKGSKFSSTNWYAQSLPPEIVNQESGYTPEDCVYLSGEGLRRFRQPIPSDLIKIAASQGVSFVTDNEYNRLRYYNKGEREIAELLISLDYIPKDYTRGAVWKINPEHIYYVSHSGSGETFVVYGRTALNDLLNTCDVDIISKEVYNKLQSEA